MSKPFLEAEWKNLAMANYLIDPGLLESYFPNHTELDFWNNNCYISLVGFMFQNTSLRGFKIPGHVDFEEVNLRFYVRYKEINKWKRGVVFIKEIVPRTALAFVANKLYNENYERLPMKHSRKTKNDHQIVTYQWKKNNWHSISVKTETATKQILANSEEEFITEHYWGYSRLSELRTAEYEVKHPRWQVYPVIDYKIDVDFGSVYGKNFEFLTRQQPQSVFLAEGSSVSIFPKRKL